MAEKSTKCIRWMLALLLFLPLMVHAAASTNVSPNPGYTDDIFTFKLDLGVSGPDYMFTLELGDGGGLEMSTWAVKFFIFGLPSLSRE